MEGRGRQSGKGSGDWRKDGGEASLLGECPVSRLVEILLEKRSVRNPQYCVGRQTFEQASHHSRKYVLG